MPGQTHEHFTLYGENEGRSASTHFAPLTPVKIMNVARSLTTGGQDFSDDLLAGLGQTFPLARKLALYGMTEAEPRISHEEFARGGGRDGCVGRPYAHVECKLEAGAWSSAANTGRLAIRGPSVMLGYIGEHGRYEGLGDDGFFRSNDLVSFDEKGRLHFRGRIDRMFKCGGKLVNPLAVEEVLRRFPGVQEVVCKAAPHALLGLALEAEILPADGFSLDSERLAAFARRECEPHAIPRVFRIVKTMEQAPSGKLLRPSAPAGSENSTPKAPGNSA